MAGPRYTYIKHYIHNLICNLIGSNYDQIPAAQFDLEILEFYNNELDEQLWTKLKDLHRRKQNALRHLPGALTNIAHYDKMAAIFDRFLTAISWIEAYHQKAKEKFLMKWEKNLMPASKTKEGGISPKDSQGLVDDMKNFTSIFKQEYEKYRSNIFYKN